VLERRSDYPTHPVAPIFEKLHEADRPHEVQSADHHEVGPLLREQPLNLAHPAPITRHHDSFVELRAILDIALQYGGECHLVAGSPCGHELSDEGGASIDLNERLREQLLLHLWRQRVEDRDLLCEG